MARQEHPKEDLIREATALTERVELQIDQSVITIGFRPDGAASLFLDDEPVYHFNAANELRRAYDDGLIKAVDGQLIRLRRERSDDAVRLIREPLSSVAQAEYLDELAVRCDAIANAIQDGRCKVTRQVSDGADALLRVKVWFDSLSHPVMVAARPNV